VYRGPRLPGGGKIKESSTVSTYYLDPETMGQKLAVRDYIEQAQPLVSQIVERFDLAGKTLMSVGPGSAQEEIALLRSGLKRAYLFDIDENKRIEPIIQTIHDPAKVDAPIVYTVGDFLDHRPGTGDYEQVDVLYFSGFTPDELRRADIQNKHRSKVLSRARYKLRSWAGLPVLNTAWPSRAVPLHDIVLAALDRYLKVGGFFVLQSYCGGVDVVQNPNFIRSWLSMLPRHGLRLVEGYYFATAPSVTLWVAYKVGAKSLGNGSGTGQAEFDRLLAALRNRPEITAFHARAQLPDCSISQFYDAAAAKAVP
jgi:hypothetical protein